MLLALLSLHPAAARAQQLHDCKAGETYSSVKFISGTYDSSYRDLLGFFSRVSYTAGTRDRLGIAAPDVSLSLGPSILLWSSDRRNTYLPTRITNAIRIRVGPRIYLRTFDDLLSRATTEVSIGFRQ